VCSVRLELLARKRITFATFLVELFLFQLTLLICPDQTVLLELQLELVDILLLRRELGLPLAYGRIKTSFGRLVRLELRADGFCRNVADLLCEQCPLPRSPSMTTLVAWPSFQHGCTVAQGA
jgi:hypothetical protein